MKLEAAECIATCYNACLCNKINQIFNDIKTYPNEVLLLDFSHFLINHSEKKFQLFMNYCYRDSYLSDYKTILSRAVEEFNGYSYFSSDNKFKKFIKNINPFIKGDIPETCIGDSSIAYQMTGIVERSNEQLKPATEKFDPDKWINYLGHNTSNPFGGSCIIIYREFGPFQSIAYLVFKYPIDGFDSLFSFNDYHELFIPSFFRDHLSSIIRNLDDLLISEMIRILIQPKFRKQVDETFHDFSGIWGGLGIER